MAKLILSPLFCILKYRSTTNSQHRQLLLLYRQRHRFRLYSYPYHLRPFRQLSPLLLLFTLYGSLSCADPRKPINYRRWLGSQPAEHVVQCGEGEDQDRGLVYMTAVGSAGAGVGAEEGDGGTIAITHGTGGWVWCGCGCGCVVAIPSSCEKG